jgi:hypothetical protein
MCAVDFVGAPKGNRTPVFAVRGRRPRPLDDGSKGRLQCGNTLYIGSTESSKGATWAAIEGLRICAPYASSAATRVPT